MKKIKNSYIAKLFLSLISIYTIVFLLLFIPQGLIFRNLYVDRTINSAILKSEELFDELDNNNIQEKIEVFSQETQTQAVLVPLSELNSNIGVLSLQLVTISSNGEDYTIFSPIIDKVTYEVGSLVQAKLLIHDDSGNYVPLAMNVDGKKVIMPRRGEISSIYRELIPGISSFDSFQVSGTISSISTVDPINPKPINPIISSEVLNIATQNYVDATNFSDNGFYYFTENEDTKVSNLVFFNIDNVDGQDLVLIAVYPMSHIDDIISAIRTVNIYIFIAILILLIVSSFFYSKQFSKPLLYINEMTKELSSLNFNTPMITLSTEDEFSELAANINTLSINLKTALETLSNQNRQLSKQINLENKNEELRKTFIQGMSHELKTPLAIIQASAEAIENDVFETALEKTNTLQTIQKEVSKTNHMISNMLEVYKLDTASYEHNWEDIRLDNLVRATVESFELLHQNKKQDIILKLDEAHVRADEEKMKMVFSNLFTNAIKYSPEYAEIEIQIVDKEALISFHIKNNGVSIGEVQLNHLFEPFYRLDKSRSRSEGSTGLGLYIVQQILEQHNSVCHVTSDDNSVTFSFTLKK